MPRIMCAGLIAVDMVFDVAAYPAKGTKNRANTSHMISGGGALNAASAIAGLGGDVSLGGAIGDDELGAFLRKLMRDRQIDDQFLSVMPGVPTSRSAILITPDGDRTINNHREPALAKGDFAFPDGFAFDAALIDTRWPEGAAQIAAAANHAGKPVVVDAEAPVSPAAKVLEAASHVVFSEQGLADYCGDNDAAALKSAQSQLGNWCAVTRGADAVLCCDGAGFAEIPAFPKDAKNTLGAGDVWHGAFTLALTNQFDALRAVHWANAAASLKVQRAISDEALPTTVEIEALLNAEAAQATDNGR